MEKILLERAGSIAIVKIANERKHNALTASMASELETALIDAENDPSVRCVVVTGSGKAAFSSGHDLQELLHDRDLAASEALNRPLYMARTMKTPAIAAINGIAHAGGLILALSCDIRVCEPTADFAAPGARIGLLPIGGQISRLSSLVPPNVAFEMLATARRFSAHEAYHSGLVNKVSAFGHVLDEALAMAEQIAGNSSIVVSAIKHGINLRQAEGQMAADRFEWDEGHRLQSGPDAEEGVRAFLEKRQPNFQ